LLLFGIFTLAIVGCFIYLTVNNRRIRNMIDRFVNESMELQPVVLSNIKLRCWVTNKKIYIYPNNRCDLYLFDDFLAIIRRQQSVFGFIPILAASDIKSLEGKFKHFDIYKLEKLLIKQNIKDEVDLELSDLIYKHYKVEITLKELTSEQIGQLEKIKNWTKE
jgi:hypothetical protein